MDEPSVNKYIYQGKYRFRGIKKMSRSEKHTRKKHRIADKKKFVTGILMLLLILAALIAGLYYLMAKVLWKDLISDIKTDENVTQSAITVEQKKEKAENPYKAWPNTTTKDSAYPLSKVSDDILVLVNKTHALTSEYAADDLVTVEHCDPDVGTKYTRMMRQVAADAFEELYKGAQEAGYNIIMRTGYRSYSYQESLFKSYADKNGEEAANTYSARAGQSEHQTGLCCDVGRPGKGLTSFDGTQEAKWVEENCYKYGFILRFPAEKTDITGYIYESWHIRYVGLDAAKLIYENKLTLEEYLDLLKD